MFEHIMKCRVICMLTFVHLSFPAVRNGNDINVYPLADAGVLRCSSSVNWKKYRSAHRIQIHFRMCAVLIFYLFNSIWINIFMATLNTSLSSIFAHSFLLPKLFREIYMWFLRLYKKILINFVNQVVWKNSNKFD